MKPENLNGSAPAASCCDSWPSDGMRATIEENREFFRSKRALVTGAFGFVGGHLARALLALGVVVTALDIDCASTREAQLNLTGLRNEMRVVEADITERAAMRDIIAEGEFDFVFHLAAGATTIEKAIGDPYGTILANTMGFVNLAEGARLLPVEKRPVIIYASTDKVYGECDELPYVEEKTNLGGVGVYDAAKLSADIFAATYHKALGVPTIVLRMCNLFGPYDFNIDYRLIPKAMRNVFRDREAPELYLNALEHFRDYLFVEDAARAFIHLARNEKCRGRVYNLPGAHYAATPDVLREVVETVGKMQDEAPPESEFARHRWDRGIRTVPSDPSLIVISKQHLDGSRIGREADFFPATDFYDGVRRTIEFYRWYFLRHAPEKVEPPREELRVLASLDEEPEDDLKVITLSPHAPVEDAPPLRIVANG